MKPHQKPIVGIIRDARGTAGMVFMPETQDFECQCGAKSRIAINRNGASLCVDCDAKLTPEATAP